MTLVHRSDRPVYEWPAVTSAAALAVCRALEDLSLRPSIKWPNDVVLPGGKVAGVLAEAAGRVVLVGIGINVLHRAEDFPGALRETATSLRLELAASAGADPEEVFEMLLAHLADVLGANERAGTGAWLAQVWERSAVRDRRVVVQSAAGETTAGLAVGLGPVGELIIETDRGRVGIANGTITNLEDR
jgi:BirA family biotin operon repressor/biotin-[acetyl-CoA-carboxylase] ligase